MRGSPHIHMFIWTKEHQDLQAEFGRSLAPAFIDKYVSTTLPDDSDPELKYLVEKLQTHHHTKPCTKKISFADLIFPNQNQKTPELKPILIREIHLGFMLPGGKKLIP